MGSVFDTKPGDCRVGVAGHTQGIGKRFTMLFFAARVVRHPVMRNPTLVVLTEIKGVSSESPIVPRLLRLPLLLRTLRMTGWPRLDAITDEAESFRRQRLPRKWWQ